MNSTFNGNPLWQALLLAVLSVCYPWVVEAAEQQTFPELFPESGSETLAEKFKGELLYSNPLAEPADVANWKMEGPGVVSFAEEWMQMYSPDEQMHHVFWCPEDFPASFMAEWEVQNLHTDAGLVIVLFAAKGINGGSRAKKVSPHAQLPSIKFA